MLILKLIIILLESNLHTFPLNENFNYTSAKLLHIFNIYICRLLRKIFANQNNIAYNSCSLKKKTLKASEFSKNLDVLDNIFNNTDIYCVCFLKPETVNKNAERKCELNLR